MAKSSTSVYGFEFRESLIGLEHPSSRAFILGNSATVTIGDPVRLNSDGLLVRSAAGEAVLGILDGIEDQNGIPAFSPRAQGTAGSTLTPDDTIATSATNSSDGTRKLKGRVIIDIAGTNLYYNNASTALAQTNVGQLFDVGATVGRISTASASDTNGQFQLVQLDPDNDGTTTKGLFRIVEGQLAIGIDQGTAKIT